MTTNTKLKELVRLISSHSTEEAVYATTIAFHAAKDYADKQPEKFKQQYGTTGYEIVQNFFIIRPE